MPQSDCLGFYRTNVASSISCHCHCWCCGPGCVPSRGCSSLLPTSHRPLWLFSTDLSPLTSATSSAASPHPSPPIPLNSPGGGLQTGPPILHLSLCLCPLCSPPAQTLGSTTSLALANGIEVDETQAHCTTGGALSLAPLLLPAARQNGHVMTHRR